MFHGGMREIDGWNTWNDTSGSHLFKPGQVVISNTTSPATYSSASNVIANIATANG